MIAVRAYTIPASHLGSRTCRNIDADQPEEYVRSVLARITGCDPASIEVSGAFGLHAECADRICELLIGDLLIMGGLATDADREAHADALKRQIDELSVIE